MRKPTLRRVAALAAAGLALAAGGGAAFAATSGGDDRDAFLGDVAKRLGVQQTALEDAIEEASKARVDAAVEDGELTEEQAEAIKERIEEGDGPILGGPIFGAVRASASPARVTTCAWTCGRSTRPRPSTSA